MAYENKCLSCGTEWVSPTNAGRSEECPGCGANRPQMLRSSLRKDREDVNEENTSSKFQPTDEAVVEKTTEPEDPETMSPEARKIFYSKYSFPSTNEAPVEDPGPELEVTHDKDPNDGPEPNLN